MNLIIDIGNSLIKCFVIKHDEIIHTTTIELLTLDFPQDILNQFPDIKHAIFCSVRKDSHNDVREFLASKLDYFIDFNHRTSTPLRNLYGTPETLGCDRLAAAVGAWHFFPKCDLMIFDCGTAITIDFVSKDGEYLGGNISPGINTRFKALNTFTGKLPMGKIKDDTPAIGRNTQEAIEAGVLNGIVAEIESYIQHNKGYKIVFTGGDAIFFAKKLKTPLFIINNLVSLGLNKVLTHNLSLKHK